MKYVYIVVITFLLGLTAGLYLGWRYLRPPAQDHLLGQQIVQEHIKGPGRIRNKDFDFSGAEITFRSVATGEAESFTRIPKGFIPEAWNWMYAVHNVQASVLFQYAGGIRTSYGVQYLHRWGHFHAGGGPILGDLKGIALSAGACF